MKSSFTTASGPTVATPTIERNRKKLDAMIAQKKKPLVLKAGQKRRPGVMQ